MKEAKKMCCPFLDGTNSRCNADASPYIPSIYELREYCNRPYHKKCPFYLDLHVWTFLNSDLF